MIREKIPILYDLITGKTVMRRNAEIYAYLANGQTAPLILAPIKISTGEIYQVIPKTLKTQNKIKQKHPTFSHFFLSYR